LILLLAGGRPHRLSFQRASKQYLHAKVPGGKRKDCYGRVRSRRRSLLNTIRSGVLRSAVVLVASTVCLQAAIAKQNPTENKAPVELRSVDSKINSVQGRQLRLRSLTLEPGGIVELHSHKDRPTVLYVIRGTLTSHPQGVVVRAGVGFAQDQDGDYWIQNTGNEPTEFIWLPLDKSSP
jgi:mannose-6-phosphate isomerase-like protein (cupin superfamily)